MGTKIHRSKESPDRTDLSWDERWLGPDEGLITCWEVGRDKRAKEPDLAQRAEKGELPILGWKGGVEKSIRAKVKYGSLNYLAQWQGLRGEDLDIDIDKGTELTCSRTGVTVTYSPDQSKY